jgi:hypothetical protein
MRGLLTKTMTVSGLLLFALGSLSFAQYRDPYYRGNDPYNRGNNDPYYRNDPYNQNDPYSRGGRGYGNNVSALLDKVNYDLQRAASQWRYNGGDMRRVQKAQEHLYNFRNRLNSGRYDRGELDRAIGDIQSVCDHMGGNWRERSVLTEDLARLREFRSLQANGNYRYDPYGYRR